MLAMVDRFTANGRTYRAPQQPVLAVCADGWDPAYVDDALTRGLMPALAGALADGGTYTRAVAQVPTFTNPNNVAIVTGVDAARNGIAGNHYRDASGAEVQVTDPGFLRAQTIHAAAHAAGVPVLCVTAKDKLRRLLSSGEVPAYSAELAHEQSLPDGTPILEVIGRPNPGIYDPALSPYTIDLALALADRLGARLVYASLTDFVQHSAAPGEAMADTFYRAIDASLARALAADFVVGLVADHGMNAKAAPDGTPNVRFLDDALADAGVAGATLCPITDPYVAHHAALGSLAWVHLADPAPAVRDRARGALAALAGVEAVLDRGAAAAAFALPADRIGDLVVLADAETVLGRSAAVHDLSALHGTLRSHGGLHERAVPLIITAPLAAGAIEGRTLHNRDLHDLLLNHVRVAVPA